ncbi:hypothetical protein PHYSODRAFT_304761 [Phytophthora sojae]|uniref:Uncharacterized protein n=1 Tax=Phytophthora sojae (strain P6497) TaxID=1094619 RepID=G4ZZB8_PHYSP|nr:hypothetical protein PHYSODRAFT_304761 [Phytophthora sojae]EGZ11140.1 hypothetical protein PHYSODRAFT_304761 [Phytophthora sojae]|eukprot:XP_009533885.1 hypothetical protein PHYSODRAFT_304761 [Phytophthora sojae]
MDDEHLNAVFRFKHKARSDRQDAALSWTLMERFDTFVNTLEATELGNLSCGRLDPLADDRVVPAAAFSVHELEVLKEEHTGGRPRDTCWALVKAAIERNLCCGRGLFRKTLTLFKLSLIQSEIARAEDVFSTDSIDLKRGCDLVDDLFFMLQVVVQHVIELLGDGYDVASLQEQCADSRASIDGFVGALNLQTAKQYVLPEFTALQQLNGLSCGVEILSPKRDNESSSSESIEDRRRRALVNLKPCQFVGGASCSLENLLLWVRSDNAAPQSYKRILTLRTIEAFLFARSPALVDGGNVQQAEDGDELFVANMQSLVTHYQKIADEWRQYPQRTSVLSAEQRSRQLLMWIAFCLVHQKCLHEFPLCSEYNIALEWKDLKVAVLSDRAAVEALQRVAQYVRGWNLKTGGARLFHLTDQEPTFSFAWKFAEGNPSMEERYNQEVEAWKAHVQSEWSEIEAKKERADNLRADKTRLNEDLRSHHNDLALEEGRLLLAYPSSLPTEPSQVATAR